ncbi:ammonium transporter [Candidatus Sumerlaeota bacterium]|nr:ammonium transporter [Candidatus Sumerlaeota bacterium]
MKMIRKSDITKLTALTLLLSATGFAQEEAATTEQLQNNINIVWTLVAATLVMFMQPGFAMLEAGLVQAKNSVNILMKNLMDFCIGSVMFFIIGFGLMFGSSTSTGGWLGTDYFMLHGITGGADWTYTFWMFQVVFAATAATIVSGAVAGRIKFHSYLIYCVAICAFIYPIFGKWAWGSLLNDNGAGWLEGKGFIDFAGSTVVHSIGGWLALAGAIVAGVRIGKYDKNGKPKAILGHSIPMAALGVFILWFGWFGFNAGSTTTGDGEIGRVAVTTNLAAVAGAIGAMITSWILFKKPEATMTLNGVIAGLVSITAGCYTVTPIGSLAIGLIGGVLVVFSVLFIERVLKIDDPVGAISAHGVCGAWGTLACGVFGAEAVLGIGDANTGFLYGGGFSQFGVQFLGVIAAFIWAFGTGMALFTAIKYTVGIRVSPEVEREGLDTHEHGIPAYTHDMGEEAPMVPVID